LPEYRVFETQQFERDLREIARSGQHAIAAKLRAVVYPQLTAHPHYGPNARKLKGYAPPTWRYRIGAWRFFHEIDETRRVVSMTAASHRGSAY
jgi:mRNA interferase RelE/StbE